MKLLFELLKSNLEMTSREASKLKTDDLSFYNRLSFDLNLYNIPNQLIDLNSVYGFGNHKFIIANINEKEINKYYIIDINLEEKIIVVNTEKLTAYLEQFNVVNKLAVSELFNNSYMTR